MKKCQLCGLDDLARNVTCQACGEASWLEYPDPVEEASTEPGIIEEATVEEAPARKRGRPRKDST